MITRTTEVRGVIRFAVLSVAVAVLPACAATLSRRAATMETASVRLLDVLKVSANGDPAQAVIPVTLPVHAPVATCDVVIIGGGTGGTAAALAAARNGARVCLTEPTHWLGGQMTAQGVSAFDGNAFSDTTGSTATYIELKRGIREVYLRRKRPGAPDGKRFNPGACWVSDECFEPPVAVHVLHAMLAPYLGSGRLRVWLHSVPVRAERRSDHITSVLVYDFGRQSWIRLRGAYFLDASELGDLLPLAGADRITGAESRQQTGEPDAPATADPRATQSFTWDFILARDERRPDASPQPPGYSSYLHQYGLTVDYGHGKLLTYGVFRHTPGTPGSFWTYRRVIAADQFPAGAYASDLSLINWDSNDYCNPDVLSSDPQLQARALQKGKQASLGFLWWLQHEVSRDDGSGRGYPGLHLIKSEMGSRDGLSQYPYIRESRRMLALRTIVEQDVSDHFQHGARARLYGDSVGIGLYAIDIHSCRHHDFTSRAKPYELPLGALISRNVGNLLAASKDIGTTHITNGAYRLHPIEWAIGTAAGTTAALALRWKHTPTQIDRNGKLLRALQLRLVQQGQPIFWFDDVLPSSDDFTAAQFLAAAGVLPQPGDSLHFSANAAVSGDDAALALERAAAATGSSLSAGLVDRLRSMKSPLAWPALAAAGHGAAHRQSPVRNGAFARWLLTWFETPKETRTWQSTGNAHPGQE